MKTIFKSIANGILCFLTPFAWIIGIALGSVIALIVFIFYAFYSLFLFFTGRSVLNNLPEDEKVREIKKTQAARAKAYQEKQAEAAKKPIDQPVMNNSYMQQPQQANNQYNQQYQQPYYQQEPIQHQEEPFHQSVSEPQREDPVFPEITPDDIAYAPKNSEPQMEVDENEIPF